MTSNSPQEKMEERFDSSTCKYRDYCAILQSEHNKLWKLASNPFIVVGEARVTGTGIALEILGDLPAEPRLGLAPGTFPTTIEAALGMLHPDDRQACLEAVEGSRAT